jgi:hypothetical protein
VARIIKTIEIEGQPAGALLDKRKGFSGAVRFLLDALRDIAGFRVGDALDERLLQDEGEA